MYMLMSFKNKDKPQFPCFNYINTLEKIVFVKPFHRVFRIMLTDVLKYQILKWGKFKEKTCKLISMKNVINAPVSLYCPSFLLALCSGILTWGNCLLALRKPVKLHWTTALTWENFSPKQHLHKYPQPQTHIKRW